MSPGVQNLALLRGINVGGRNIVKMADLRAAFEEMAFEDVATYIQSGNVLFRAPRGPRAELSRRIETGLGRRFETELRVVVVAHSALRRVVAEAPDGFGSEAALCDVMFLRSPLSAARAFTLLELKDGVDRAWAGKGVVYFERVAAEASRSRMSKIVARPEYQEMTIRSWRTTTKLLDLLEARSRGGSG